MAEERVQRRLAAILAADVVGYSRLMRADEAGTLGQIKALRSEVFHPKVEEYGGRLFKTTGDGVLIEFPSAVDAVQHAIDVQNAMADRNSGVDEDQQIVLRIGITLGDVIDDEDDIYGDGVNIASRLEGLADPGGIAVSLLVRESVRHKLSVDFDDLGEQSVKNIADPVHVFQVRRDDTERRLAGAADASFRRPAVAVLPFVNMSGDPEQEYFADGLTEDIITALTAWRFFPVIARNSTFAYKGQSPDIRQVGEELNARYVIEGSVRKSANRVRVTAQFINAETGHHVWAERFDRDLENIFELQDEITAKIAAVISPELVKAESERLETNRPENLDAWDYCQRGKYMMNDFSKEGLISARALFEKAVELDPNSVDGWWGISHTYHREFWIGSSQDLDEIRSKVLEAARRAVELDDTNAAAHNRLCHAYTINKRYEEAIAEAKWAIDLNPIDPTAHAGLGCILPLAGRPDEGVTSLETTINLNLRHPRVDLHRAILARAYLDAHRYEEAVDMARQAIQRGRFNMGEHLTLASALGHLGRGEEAREVIDGMEEYKDFKISDIVLNPWWQLYKEPEPNEHLYEGLRKAGLPE
jgi:adenylate cyclase